jgi:hypothetical protein
MNSKQASCKLTINWHTLPNSTKQNFPWVRLLVEISDGGMGQPSPIFKADKLTQIYKNAHCNRIGSLV